jgi:hypothetical protein
MRTALVLLFVCLAIFALSQICRAQGESALPFLVTPSSPEGNGMGGIVGATPTDHPMGILENPGQLGMTALDHYFLVGFYPSSTEWLPGFGNPDITYSASAFSAGLNLKKVIPVPIDLSVGVAYSHVSLNYGLFALTGPDPSVLSYFRPEDHSDNWSFGIGAEYYIKLGLGYTHKSVESNLAPFNVQGQGRQAVADVSTYDWGAIAQIPVTRIIEQLSGTPVIFWERVHPSLDITVGYARRNLGDDFVTYIDPAQADPFPRTAMLGMSYRGGFTLPFRSTSWEVLSFTLAREAEDLLVQRFPAPVDSNGIPTGEPPLPQYVGGSGAIQFFNNVIWGEGNGHITLRKGWQIGFGEFLQIRGGSVGGRGVSYTTTGYGLRLAPLLKLIALLSPATADSPVGGFILAHLDVGFDHASYTYDDLSNPNNGVTFNGLSVLIK